MQCKQNVMRQHGQLMDVIHQAFLFPDTVQAHTMIKVILQCMDTVP